VIPPNELSMKVTDCDSISLPGKTPKEQSQLQLTDVAIDAILAYLTMTITPGRTMAIKVSESRIFLALDEIPLERYPVDPMVELIFLPCCVRAKHWSLVVFHVAQNEYKLYDSFFVPDSTMIRKATKISRQFAAHYAVPPFGTSSFTVETNCRFQREETLDCGVHVAYMAQQLSRGEEIEASENMVKLRFDFRAAVLRLVGVEELPVEN
jgi:Ulp1 protease family, C-terminal catalytic domain